MARPRTRLLAVRITEPMLRELDAQGDRLQALYEWATVRRTDVVRVLLMSAFERDLPESIPTEPIRAHHLLSVRVPAELIDKLEKLTRALGPTVSRSDVVRTLLSQELTLANEVPK